MTTRGTPGEWPLDLLDWKHRVGAMYAAVRAGGDGEATLAAFRRDKDVLFATHPQSPIPSGERAHFTGLRYFPHRPDLRSEVELEPDPDGQELLLPASSDEPFRFRLIGRVRPVLVGQRVSLGVYWLTSYGGGLFLPFRDATAGRETYGAGRYLLDTVKGADLGANGGGRLVVDFNYAYNPSCSYDPAWSCPLAPPENRLEIAIEAGERLWTPAG
jgi:uncharacterized protein (DUF1684 family)